MSKPKKPGVRYGVYTAEGRLLSTWALRSEAQSFVQPGLGRVVRQIGPMGIWPTVSAEQYRRDKDPKAITSVPRPTKGSTADVEGRPSQNKPPPSGPKPEAGGRGSPGFRSHRRSGR
jgi:hypothetical protein